MSEIVARPSPEGSAVRSRRGQSMVEFALVLPMLLVLLLGIADFGRVFTAGITVDAAARNAAEAVAQEYLRHPPGPMDQPAPPGDVAYYQPLHDLAARTACRESRLLPETTYDEATAQCRWTAEDGTPAEDVPLIMTCIHDEQDPLCGQIAFGASVPPGGADICPGFRTSPTPAMEGALEASRYVEVRICYRFSTIVNLESIDLPLGWGISVGDIYLEKDRTFVVGYYPPPPTPEPPPQLPPPPPTAVPTEEPTPTPTESPSESPTSTPTDVATPDPTQQPPPPEPTPVPTPVPTPAPDPTPSEPAPSEPAP